jgi:hypothetical protein
MSTTTATQTLATAILNAGGTTYLQGNPGCGKSTALAGIAEEAIAAGREVIAINLHGGDGHINHIDGARLITRAPEAVRFLHGTLDRFRFDAIGFADTVGPVILVEEITEIAPEVAKLLGELIQTRSSVFTTVLAYSRPGRFPGGGLLPGLSGSQLSQAPRDDLTTIYLGAGAPANGRAVASVRGQRPELFSF